MKRVINLDNLIGEGYEDFWNFKGRYRLVKGSRGSKKSMTTTFWYLINMIRYPLANVLVIRNTNESNRDSTFPKFLQCISRLKMEDEWKVNRSTMTITRRKTGQEIRFGGLDTPYKHTSMDVQHGSLCWLWFEEAWEIKDFSKVKTLDLSVRTPEDMLKTGLFDQLTFTFNPYRSFWARFEYYDKCDLRSPAYDEEFSKKCLCKTTTYKCNKWLSQDYIDTLEANKSNPLLWKVIGEGDWGVPGDTIYTYQKDWDILKIPVEYSDEELKNETMRKAQYKRSKEKFLEGIYKMHPDGRWVCGLDFGYITSPSAFVAMFVDMKSRTAWLYEEIFMEGMTIRKVGQKLVEEGYRKARIIADSAEPKSIDELEEDFDFTDIERSRKGKDSVHHGIQFVKSYKTWILEDCVRTISEIEAYSWKPDPQTGILTDEPIKENDHFMDAMRYAMSEIAVRAGIL